MKSGKRCFSLLVVFPAIFLITAAFNVSLCLASSATLTWSVPTTNADGSPLTDLAGYKIYYGTQPHTYGAPIDVGLTAGNPPTYKINNLGSGTFYFAVTSYDNSGLESGFSAEVSQAIASPDSQGKQMSGGCGLIKPINGGFSGPGQVIDIIFLYLICLGFIFKKISMKILTYRGTRLNLLSEFNSNLRCKMGFQKLISIMIAFISMVILSENLALAANHYVLPAAVGSGNGSDWNNAMAAPTSGTIWVRGDTYYFGGGNYSIGLNFNTSVSGTLYIYLKKATAADHGTDTGWAACACSGQALITSPGSTALDFSTSYWQVLGGEGSGKTGMGFVFAVTTYTGAANTVSLGNLVNTDHFVFDHIEAKSKVFYGNTDTQGPHTSAFYGAFVKGNVTLTNSYIHENTWGALVQIGNQGGSPAPDTILIDGNYFENAYNKELCSCRNIRNLTWRNNIAKNVGGTAFINFDGGNNLYVYNNVFYIYDGVDYNTSTSWIGDFTALCSGCSALHDVYIYGNTFFMNNTGNNQIDGIYFHNATGNVFVENNLFYNPTTNFLMNGTHDSNACYPSARCGAVAGEAHGQILSSDPFVSSVNDNFRLTGLTNSGQILSPPYNTDILGVTRGYNGNWSRGAYEYGSGTAMSAPSAPVLSPNIIIQN